MRRPPSTDPDAGRYLDYAIKLRTVRQSPDGRPIAAGMPPVIEIGEPLFFGGRLDTLARRFVGPAESHQVWYVGERQREILLREEGAQNTLLYSAEGGGKTVLMAQWVILQTILMLQAGEQGAIGLTAPTNDRLGTLINAVSDLVLVDSPREQNPRSWATYYTDAREFRFKTGHLAQCRSTKKQSGATGSPVQGYTWKRAAMDEAQDQVEQGAYPDIVARLRGSRRSRIMATATAKDSPTWRTWRDALSENWALERIQYSETPFVWPEHWMLLKSECSPREWQRRALALDVGPERMVYETWRRSENLRPIPELGALDVTEEVLRPWGQGLALLVGHDPGRLCHVSVFLKAFRLPAARSHAWWVVGELTTEGTSEQHAKKLLDVVRERFRCNQNDWRGNPSEFGPKIFVRADPYSNSSNDRNQPHKSIYTVFRNLGIRILPAATKASTSEVKAAAIPKEAGITMVRSLFCNASGGRRLFVNVDDRGAPVAQKLVSAIEMSERDLAGEAETEKKDKNDLSHWPAALRYALWALERPRSGVAA